MITSKEMIYFTPVNTVFRKLHSTEFAALELTDRIFEDIDDKTMSLAIFMDMSKAFSTLNHQILLNELNFFG